MRLLLVVASLAAAVLVSGCATATRGSTEMVSFVSDPAGAKMTTSTGLTCTTPCTLEVPRSDTFTATFALEDQTEQVFVDTQIAEAVGATTAANVLLTPIIAIPVAIAVDAASGANLDHVPNPVIVTFDKEALAKAAPEGESTGENSEGIAAAAPTTETNAAPKLAAASPIKVAAAPKKPEPDPKHVRLTLDFDTNVYSYCNGITEFVPSKALDEETPAWHAIEYSQAPGLNLKARVQPVGGSYVLEVWPHSDDWRESDVIRVQLSSLDVGASNRAFSTKPVELDLFNQCGPFVVYASVEEVS